MNHYDSPNQYSTSSKQPPRQIRPQRLLVSIGTAVLALLVTWAVVAAYSTSSDLPQCQDNGTSPSIMSCNWVNGQMSNANWLEGSAVPQKVQISGLSASATAVHTYTWSVTWSNKVYYHGYDWLVSYAQAQQLHQDYVGSPLNLNSCTSGTNAEQTTCTNLHTSGYSQTIDIPDDTFVSGSAVNGGSALPRIQAFESKYGNRTMTLWTDRPITGTAVLTFYHSADTTGFPPIANNGDAIAGSTLIRYTVYFTSSADTFMLEYGAHFALSGNPYVDPMAWGWDTTNGGYGAAGLYPSAPWHVKDPGLDAGAGNLGSQDNQAKVQNPSSYPINSNSTWNSTTKRATDAITMTTASNDTITGTISYWVCGDTTVPYTDTLTNGCTSTTTATFVGNAYVTFAGKTANAVSPVFSPTVSGRYCFLTIFTPAKNGNIYNFGPTADTNGTTECFMAFGPNAITLNAMIARGEAGIPVALVVFISMGVAAVLVIVWARRHRTA
jgi:hypothetical protein